MSRDRFKLSVAVFLFLIKDDSILLLKRENTGWMDGFFSVPAGSLDGSETLAAAAIRETSEEVGVAVKSHNIHFIHTMHCVTHGQEWIGQYFMATKWKGTPQVQEPHKHSETIWSPLAFLPTNTIPYVVQAVNHYSQNSFYSEYQDRDE